MSATLAEKMEEGDIKKNINPQEINTEENNISNPQIEEENKVNENENLPSNENNNDDNENLNEEENEKQENDNNDNLDQSEKNEEEEEEEGENDENEENEEEEKEINYNKEETENKSSFYQRNNYSKNTLLDSNSEGHLHIGKNPFRTTGHFMQINPHFFILNRQIENIRDTIYNETKKCLVLKGSIQLSENIIREESVNVVKDIFEKIHMVRTMCNNEAKNIGKLFNRVSAEFVKISKVHRDIKKELELCDYRINNCEGDIGYKMLIKPHYSFLRKAGYK